MTEEHLERPWVVDTGCSSTQEVGTETVKQQLHAYILEISLQKSSCIPMQWGLSPEIVLFIEADLESISWASKNCSNTVASDLGDCWPSIMPSGTFSEKTSLTIYFESSTHGRLSPRWLPNSPTQKLMQLRLQLFDVDLVFITVHQQPEACAHFRSPNLDEISLLIRPKEQYLTSRLKCASGAIGRLQYLLWELIVTPCPAELEVHPHWGHRLIHHDALNHACQTPRPACRADHSGFNLRRPRFLQCCLLWEQQHAIVSRGKQIYSLAMHLGVSCSDENVWGFDAFASDWLFTRMNNHTHHRISLQVSRAAVKLSRIAKVTTEGSLCSQMYHCQHCL